MTSESRAAVITGKPPLVEYDTIFLTVMGIILGLYFFLYPDDPLTPIRWVIGSFVTASVFALYFVRLNAFLRDRWISSVELSSDCVRFKLANGRIIVSKWPALGLRGRKPRIGRSVYFKVQHENRLSEHERARSGTTIIPVTLQQGKAILSHPECPKISLTSSERLRLDRA